MFKTAKDLLERPADMTVRQHLEAVREARDDHYAVIKDLTANAEILGRDLLASEQRTYDTHLKEVESLSKLVEKITESPEARGVDYEQIIGGGQELRRGDGYATGSGGSTEAEYRKETPLRAGQTFAGYTRSRGLVQQSENDLDLGRYLEVLCAGRSGSEYELERRAMSEGTNSAGGFLVPTLLSSHMIDLARNSARVMQAGATIVAMENEKLDVPKWTGDPAGAWRAEAAAITTSDATIGKVSLVAKSLACITIVSRELLEDAPNVGNELIASFQASMGLKVDMAGLYGAGTSIEPQGVKGTSGITTLTNGTNGAALTNYDPLVNGVFALSNVNENATGIIYSPRTGKNLALLKDTTGQPMRAPSYLDSVPRFETNQISNTLTVGTSTDTTDIFTANWAQLLMGMRTRLIITPLTERYADTGQVGFVAWLRADVAVGRPAAFAVQTGIR